MGVKSYTLNPLPGQENEGYVQTEFGPTIIERGDTIEPKPEEKKQKASKDGLTSVIGEFGKYQLAICLILGATNVGIGWSNVANKFYNTKVDYWCAPPDGLSFNSTAEWLNMSAPWTEDNEIDRCNIFDVDYSEIDGRPDEDTPTRKCKKWEYDTEHYIDTTRQRWDLVCDNDFNFSTYATSIFFAGHMLGVLTMGLVSDWYGRKKALVIFMTLLLAFSTVSIFLDNPFAWLAVRFFVGAAQMASGTCRSVYLTEIVSGKWRSISQHWFGESFFQVSILTFGGVVYLLPNMKHLEIFVTCACIPGFIVALFIPESPRWLLTKGRVDDAKKIIRGIIKINKKPESNIDLVKPISDTTKKLNITHILRYPAMRRNLLAMSVAWLATAMGYYGLVYNTPTFDWNVYLVFILPSFFIIPLVIAEPYLENGLGRKALNFGALAIAGLSLLATALVPAGKFSHNWPVVALCWIGTVAASAAFGSDYVFAKELFPTPLRSTALSFCSAAARIGSISSPFVVLLEDFSPVLPLVFYGAVLVIGALCSFIVWPETKSLKMTESLEECEAISSTKNTWLTCSCCC